MARDGENLFRRKGERFWYFKYKGLDGKWHEQSTAKERKSDARDFRNEEMARFRAGQTPNDMKTWRLKQAIDHHLQVLRAKKSKSYRITRTSLNAVMTVFGEDKRLDKITDLDLERYQVHRLKMKKGKGQGPITGSTVNLEILYLSHILKKANLWPKISANYKRMPKNKTMVGRAITQEQFLHLVSVAREHPGWFVAFSMPRYSRPAAAASAASKSRSFASATFISPRTRHGLLFHGTRPKRTPGAARSR